MSLPQITITPAGFAAIVNAEHDGTAPVRISHVGVTPQAFNVDTVGAAVPGEIKRISTFGGKAVAVDTLHLNIRDDSSDTYTLRGFGLYLSNGVLFAVYSQATPIMEKASAATLLLATDIRFAKITATSIEVGDVDFVNPPASTTQVGVARFATDQEAAAGSSGSVGMTPKGVATYVNERFGDGAPSDLFKGLMTKATAALLRAALGLKSAALKDEGAGNGLDADLLDGQQGAYYLEYKNITGLPTQWTPAPHTHPISGVEGLQELLDRKANRSGDTFTGAVTIKDSSLRVSGWSGVSTDGVIYLGGGNSYILKESTNFTFRNEQGNFTAWLSSGGNVWTSGNFDPASKVSKAGDSMSGSLNMWGNNRNLRLLDNNLDLPCVEIGAGYGNPLDRHGWIVNRNGSGALILGGRNLSCCLSLGEGAGLSTLSGSLNVLGNLTSNSTITSGDAGFESRGSGAGYSMVERRDFGIRWSMYADVGYYNIWNSNAGNVLTVTRDGHLKVSGSVNAPGGYDTGSSLKLKEIEGKMPYGLKEVRRVSTLIGRYKRQYNPDGVRRVFFDADSLADIMPELVNKQGVEFNGEHVASVKIEQTIPPVYRAIAQLADLVDGLHAEVERLKAVH